MNERTALHQAIRAALFLCAPFVVAVLAIYLGQIESGAAVFGLIAASCAIGSIPIYRHFVRLSRLRTRASQLAAGEFKSDVGHTADDDAIADIGQALHRSAREWAVRMDAANTQLAADEIVIDSLPDPMILLDDQVRIVRVNAAARDLLGRALKGRDLSAALRHPRVLDMVEQTLADKSEHEVEFTLPDFVDRSFNARAKPLVEKPADGSAVILTLHDLTEVKRSERMQADFVANASHELRTPLSALVGFIETLRGPAADDGDARDNFLGIMHEQAQRMARLIQDLLSLSRIEMDEHTRPTGMVPIGDVLTRVARSSEPQAKDRDVDISLDLPDDEVFAVGDADQLEQVFQNLVDNAVKYGRAGGCVTVSLRRAASGPAPIYRASAEGSVVAVSVHNEGDGIAPEHLPRLTERFYRVDAARSRELGGTGLGLAIVKHIVNRHRGALSIESATGRGTTFTIHLPAVRESNGPA